LSISLKIMFYQLYRWICFYISSGVYQYIQLHTHRLDQGVQVFPEIMVPLVETPEVCIFT
jgi:hypothetical protein